jgi:hypothetical protein
MQDMVWSCHYSLNFKAHFHHILVLQELQASGTDICGVLLL